MIKHLLDSEIINQNEVPELFDKNNFTINGRNYLEAIIIGNVMEEDQIKVLNLDGMMNYRQKIIKAIVPLLQNSKLEGNFIVELNEAVLHLYNSNGNLFEYYSQQNIFDQQNINEDVVFLAIQLQRKENEFKNFVNEVNDVLKNQTIDMFLGRVKTKQDIYAEYKKGFSKSEQAIINAVGRSKAVNVDNASSEANPTGAELIQPDNGIEGQSEGIGEVVTEPIYKNGQVVTYQGKEYTINGINDTDGLVDLEDAKGKLMHEEVPMGELNTPEAEIAETPKAEPTKQAWEMTREEIVRNPLYQKGDTAKHKKSIQQALSEGKQVPENVLADYPELKQEVKPESKMNESWKNEFERAKKENDLQALDTLYNKVKVVLNGLAQGKGEATVKEFEALKKEIEDWAADYHFGKDEVKIAQQRTHTPTQSQLHF
ncbi:MAG: hypothetical protein Q7U47_15275 [Paludibacter sp.]|nr:hypothetical protein [Paludibacter sp.]